MRGGKRSGAGRPRKVSDVLRRERAIVARRKWWRDHGNYRRKLQTAGLLAKLNEGKDNGRQPRY